MTSLTESAFDNKVGQANRPLKTGKSHFKKGSTVERRTVSIRFALIAFLSLAACDKTSASQKESPSPPTVNIGDVIMIPKTDIVEIAKIAEPWQQHEQCFVFRDALITVVAVSHHYVLARYDRAPAHPQSGVECINGASILIWKNYLPGMQEEYRRKAAEQNEKNDLVRRIHGD